MRTLLVLEAVLGFDAPVSAQALGKVVDLPKQTLHRILVALTESGFLQREVDSAVYYPGPRLQRMGTELLASAPGRNIRTAILSRLATEVGETCNLCIAATDHMIYLERVETDWPLRVQLPIGSRVPLHCTASGKLYLSSLNNDQLTLLLQALDTSAVTKNTISDFDALSIELSRIRNRGYAEDNEEFIDGMVAISVPVLQAGSGALLACLAVHGPSPRITLDQLRDHVPRLRAAASILAQALTNWQTDAAGY
jgi:DNA-binding IclR family transcriptional regulator